MGYIKIFCFSLTITATGVASVVAQDGQAIGLGAKVYAENCSRCHEAPDPRSRDRHQWNAITLHMRVSSDLSREDQQHLLAFLSSSTTASRAPDVNGHGVPDQRQTAHVGDAPTTPVSPSQTPDPDLSRGSPAPHTVQISPSPTSDSHHIPKQTPQGWIAPPGEASMPNPMSGGATELKEGRSLYSQNCAICHGAGGKGDGVGGMYLSPKPGDFTDSSTRNQSDGALFWKLSTGHNAMPPFTGMSEPQRWKIISYIRSLSPMPAQSVSDSKGPQEPLATPARPQVVSHPDDKASTASPSATPTTDAHASPPESAASSDASTVSPKTPSSANIAKSTPSHTGPVWIAPPAEASNVNPVPDGAKEREEGRALYAQSCAICHGAGGKGDGVSGLALMPRPNDFTDASERSQSDGALFWKMSTGRNGMPSFVGMPEPQRWKMLRYLRTLEPQQPTSQTTSLVVSPELLKAAGLEDVDAAEKWWSDINKPGDDIASRYVIEQVLPDSVAPIPAEDLALNRALMKLCFEVVDRNSSPEVWRGVAEMAALLEVKHFDEKCLHQTLTKSEALQELRALFTYNKLLTSEPPKKTVR